MRTRDAYNTFNGNFACTLDEFSPMFEELVRFHRVRPKVGKEAKNGQWSPRHCAAAALSDLLQSFWSATHLIDTAYLGGRTQAIATNGSLITWNTLRHLLIENHPTEVWAVMIWMRWIEKGGAT